MDVLEIKPLSVASFAPVFSHRLGRLVISSLWFPSLYGAAFLCLCVSRLIAPALRVVNPVAAWLAFLPHVPRTTADVLLQLFWEARAEEWNCLVPEGGAPGVSTTVCQRHHP